MNEDVYWCCNKFKESLDKGLISYDKFDSKFEIEVFLNYDYNFGCETEWTTITHCPYCGSVLAK